MRPTFSSYQYSPTFFYTGNMYQPDNLQIFIKSQKQNIRVHTLYPIANVMDYLLTGYLTGWAKIYNAVKGIFHELSQPRTQGRDVHSAKLWNDFKNLFRGIAAVLPFTGIALILFDATRTCILIAKIEKQTKMQENIAGIAMDGKIVTMISLDKIDRICSKNSKFLENPDQVRLNSFRYMSLKLLKRASKDKPLLPLDQLYPKLTQLPG